MGRRVSFADPAQLESVREFIKEEEEREKSGESYQSGAQSEGVPAGFGLVEEASVDVYPWYKVIARRRSSLRLRRRL